MADAPPKVSFGLFTSFCLLLIFLFQLRVYPLDNEELSILHDSAVVQTLTRAEADDPLSYHLDIDKVVSDLRKFLPFYTDSFFCI